MPRILLILFTLLSATSLAQRDIKFDHISLEQGLSQNTVYCILQDNRGFMWFGTQDGLNKYDGYKFTVYRNDPDDPQSISHNWVWSIFQDSSGMMWIATYGGGLNKFDPRTGKFTHYKSDPEDPQSISDNFFFSIFKDNSGMMWIGASNGLNKYNPETGKFTCYIHNPEDPQSISQGIVWSIFQDNSGIMWIGTTGGLNKFNPKTGKFTHYKHNPEDPQSISNNFVRSIFQARPEHPGDNSGVMWIGTSGGLNKFNPKTGKFTYYLHNPDDPQSISNNDVLSIFQDNSGVMWIGTSEGLNKFNPKTGKFSHYKHNHKDPQSISHNAVSSIFLDNSQTMWIGTSGGGLNKFNIRPAKFAHYKHNPEDPQSISHNFIFSIFQDCPEHLGDNFGAIWIGTSGGLNKFDTKTGKFTYYKHNPEDPQSISHNAVLSISQDCPEHPGDNSGAMWIGTAGGGLNKFNPKTGKFAHYKHNPEDPQSVSNNYIWSIFHDNSGTMWIGTAGGGLNKFNPKTGKFTHYKCNHEDPHSISQNHVRKIFQDNSGTMWIGTSQGGLNKFNPRTGKFTRYKHNPEDPQSISKNRVRSIFQDKAGTIWIGTAGGGINKLVSDNNDKVKFIHYTVKDGLPNDVVYGILGDDKGNLWLSTNNGISKFTPHKEPVIPSDKEGSLDKQVTSRQSAVGNRGVFRNYDVSNGLQSNEFNQGAYFKDKDGWMYFGGINGFNAFHPDSVKDNPYLPYIVITGFQVFNKEVGIWNSRQLAVGSWQQATSNQHPATSTKLIRVGDNFYLPQDIIFTDEIILSYKDNVFSFDFTALHYIKPEKNQYAYMMENFDEDWIYCETRRFASYTNMPAGEYIFRVKGSNCDGVWNEEGASIKIIVTPPFWETLWFRISSIAFIICVIIAYIKIRERNLQKQKRVLEIKVKERTAEIREKNTVLQQQKEEITSQKDELEHTNEELDEINKQLELKNKDITDSINYAKRIQTAILPPEEYITKSLPEHFILFKPRDIVSGDFYWATVKNKSLIIAAVDCTGHGVPGAFMSMLGVSLLNEIVSKHTPAHAHSTAPPLIEGNNEKLQANEILNQLREEVISSLHQTGKKGETQDGMDIALCILNMETKQLQYAGAMNSLYIIRNNEKFPSSLQSAVGSRQGKTDVETKRASSLPATHNPQPTNHNPEPQLIEIKADRMPISIFAGKKKSFTNNEIQLQKGDTIYIFSDGYADQFGGEKRKKYSYKQFRELFISIQDKSMEEQKEILDKTFEDWKGDLEQLDDVVVIGLRIDD